MNVVYSLSPAMFVLSLLVLLFAANEVGFQIGRRLSGHDTERYHSVSSVLKNSIFGLVALLLGFSFSMTTVRFAQRQRMVLDEANAIGTCYLRATLLSDPEGSQIRNALRSYTQARLDYFRGALEPAEVEQANSAMAAALKELWGGVTAAVVADEQRVRTSQIVPAANAVIDMDATRAWASHNQTPGPLLLLLAVCAIVSSGLMGHSSGQAGRRHLGHWVALNVLVILVLFVVLDFDRPRRGLIQVNHQPFIELQQTFES